MENFLSREKFKTKVLSYTMPGVPIILSMSVVTVKLVPSLGCMK